MVSSLRIFFATCIVLLCIAVFGETEPEENEPAGEEASTAEEKQSDSESQSRDGEESDSQVDEQPKVNDSEDTDSKPNETYTRLPVQTRINPNQNVALPQDI